MRHLLIAVLVALIASTAMARGPFVTGGSFQKLRPGMSPEQVERIVGRPDGFKTVGSQVAYTYLNILISGWAWDRVDYHVIFTDDRLTEIGTGEVRQNSQTGTLFIFSH